MMRVSSFDDSIKCGSDKADEFDPAPVHPHYHESASQDYACSAFLKPGLQEEAFLSQAQHAMETTLELHDNIIDNNENPNSASNLNPKEEVAEPSPRPRDVMITVVPRNTLAAPLTSNIVSDTQPHSAFIAILIALGCSLFAIVCESAAYFVQITAILCGSIAISLNGFLGIIAFLVGVLAVFIVALIRFLTSHSFYLLLLQLAFWLLMVVIGLIVALCLSMLALSFSLADRVLPVSVAVIIACVSSVIVPCVGWRPMHFAQLVGSFRVTSLCCSKKGPGGFTFDLMHKALNFSLGDEGSCVRLLDKAITSASRLGLQVYFEAEAEALLRSICLPLLAVHIVFQTFHRASVWIRRQGTNALKDGTRQILRVAQNYAFTFPDSRLRAPLSNVTNGWLGNCGYCRLQVYNLFAQEEVTAPEFVLDEPNLATFRKFHPLLCKSLGFLGGSVALMCLDLRGATQAVDAGGCDQYVQRIFSRLSNLLTLLIVTMVGLVAVIGLFTEYILRAFLSVASAFLQIVSAIAYLIFTPILYSMLIALMVVLWAATKLLEFVVGNFAYLIGLLIGVPIIGPILRGIFALLTCQENVDFSKYGWKAMLLFARTFKGEVRQVTNAIATYLLSSIPDYVDNLIASLPFGTHLLVTTFDEDGWSKLVWNVMQNTICSGLHALFTECQFLALGCCRRLRDPSVDTYGGVWRVVDNNSAYSRCISADGTGLIRKEPNAPLFDGTIAFIRNPDGSMFVARRVDLGSGRSEMANPLSVAKG